MRAHTLSLAHIHTHIHTTYIQHTYIQHAYMHTCIHTYCTYIYTYMYIHTCTFTHKYIPREYCESLQSSVVRAASALCVHTHMHTYIHTYIHTLVLRRQQPRCLLDNAFLDTCHRLRRLHGDRAGRLRTHGDRAGRLRTHCRGRPHAHRPRKRLGEQCGRRLHARVLRAGRSESATDNRTGVCLAQA
jgi:hypothetical protein